MTGLRARFGGELVDPAHPGYNAARTVWKGVDRRPALIARCAGVGDVRAVVEYAAGSGRPLAVAGTGHDVAGRSMPDGALVLSTAAMRSVRIDVPGRRASVGAGVRWGELVAAAARHGLATTGASVATVGVAGFVLHGGLGWLMRRCGTGCDNLLGLDLVTAAGELHSVSAAERPDLFWAVRGAGSNFGVVTSLTLRLHEVPAALAGVVSYPAVLARAVLHAYRDITASAPDELVTHYYYLGGPAGQQSVGIGVCHTGDPAALDRALAPLDALPVPWRASIARTDMVGVQAVHDASTPPGGRYHTRARWLAELSDGAVDAVLAQCARGTGPLTKVFIEHLGGAIARVPAADTAFQRRDAAYSLLAVAGWLDPADTAGQLDWVRDFDAAARPFALDGGYVNYLDDDEDARIPGAYGPGYPRLVGLKRQFDPGNLFRANRNIPPGG